VLLLLLPTAIFALSCPPLPALVTATAGHAYPSLGQGPSSEACPKQYASATPAQRILPGLCDS